MSEFAIANVLPGKLNALVKNVMLQTGETDPSEAVRLVNSGEWVLSKSTRTWNREKDVIRFSLTSDGTTGKDWIPRLEGKGFRVGEYTRHVLLSKDFVVTTGVVTEVAVLICPKLSGTDRNIYNVLDNATRQMLIKPNAELACLMREKFTDNDIKAMGISYIVVMHEPINDVSGDPTFLALNCYGSGNWLAGSESRPGNVWDHHGGFAFVESQETRIRLYISK